MEINANIMTNCEMKKKDVENIKAGLQEVSEWLGSAKNEIE
jgi:hypothetical protein